ncbi:MAG TPA: hypothetical protein VFI47_15035 [Acidimicrobiales bacterium]|nr:hypothetical protein [Acidimicrobiales bacterium]
MPRRLRLVVTCLTVALLATACQVRVAVTVDVAGDGSGSVEVATGLDADALARVPDMDDDGTSGSADLGALIRKDDLVAAGWTVTGPDTGGDGVTWVRATKPFGTPEEAEAVLAEVSGPDGPLHDLRVSRRESFGRTELTFSGTADLRGGLEAFGDAGLAAALDGEPLGEDAAAIEARIGQPLADAVPVEVTARLPGDDTTWTPRLGEGPVAMASEATLYHRPTLALLGLAGACVLALLVVLVVRSVRRRA